VTGLHDVETLIINRDLVEWSAGRRWTLLRLHA
jgi:hypothetical protein